MATEKEVGAKAEAFQDKVSIKTWDTRCGEFGGVDIEYEDAKVLLVQLAEAIGEAEWYWPLREARG